MQLGLMIGYSGRELTIDLETVLEAERLGYDSVWSAESWGSDAISPLAWLAPQTTRIKLGTGVMQLPCRSPTAAAMAAQSVDALSGGRFLMGLGTSGPQVVEGWHGMPFAQSLTWLREYVLICRQVFERKAPLQFSGKRFQIPYDGPKATGQGKALKSMLHGRPDIPIYTGSMAPKSQQMCAEIADGCLLTCMVPGRDDVLLDNFRVGFERSEGRNREDNFEVLPTVGVHICDDMVQAYEPFRDQLCLYVGGMGSRQKNFYKDYLSKCGFEAECATIQERFLAGDRAAARAAVSDALIDAVHLVGPRDRIRDRFQRYRDSIATTLVVGSYDRDTVRFMAEVNAG